MPRVCDDFPLRAKSLTEPVFFRSLILGWKIDWVQRMRIFLLFTGALLALSGCLSDEKAFGTAAGYGRSYHTPIDVVMPANAPSITQQFRKIEGNEHYGFDIHAPIGTPVLAAAGGKVIRSYWGPAFGNQIEILHPADSSGKTSRTRYVHLDDRISVVGDQVARGQQIGTLGISGFLSSGFPHLHFETLYRGTSIVRSARDPNLFWVDGEGKVTCYAPKHDGLGTDTFLLTYPVPCN
ncbi:Glycyl-glycine endopeptidase ALE-1 precursor [Cognatishimia activa]|uniref:Glycyl-glycine endopeptidase ALE-1 n=2 Tax=Cognatishimia activa TaxID=1715691 RepID=A0A0N7MBC6_9RHOB|nr:Glycyl-glycine endopeptidase ALE-1 precursor [Cognatishimia activa]CUK25032.1 Glycyl-glycine endopeptidase ALE-1 precursor [Cognatishimia activa]